MKNKFIDNILIRKYLVMSLIVVASQGLPQVFNPVIAGLFLEPKAVAAINLCSPLLELYFTIILLFSMGACSLAGYSLGGNDKDKANSHFTVALFSTMSVISLIVLAVFIFRSSLTGLLCADNAELYQLTYDYTIIITDAVPTALFFSLGYFATMDGHPEKSALAATIVAISQIILIMLLLNLSSLGIKSIAIAILTSDMIGVACLVPYFFSSECSFRIVPLNGRWSHILASNLKKGMTQMSDNLIYLVYIFVINYVIIRIEKDAGIVVWSISSSILLIISNLEWAISDAKVMMGGKVWGEKDIHGFRQMIKTYRLLLLVITSLFTVFCELFPEVVLKCYGVSDAEALQYSVLPLRLSVCTIIAILVRHEGISFTIIDRDKISLAAFIVAYTLPILTTVVSALFFSELFWWSFPVCVVLEIAAYLYFHRLLLTSIDMAGESLCFYETAMEYDIAGISRTLDEVREFLTGQQVPETVINDIEHCIDEMSYNIVKHSPDKLKNKSFEIRAVVSEGTIDLIFKDAGRAFNPIISFDSDVVSTMNAGEKPMIALRMLNHYASSPEYRRLNGLNMTRMAFDYGIQKN